MSNIVACLDIILVYNVYFDVHLEKLKCVLLERQVQSQRNESIALVHQLEIWSFMNLRNGAVHGYRRDDPLSSQRPRQLDDWFRKKHEPKLLRQENHFDLIHDEEFSKLAMSHSFPNSFTTVPDFKISKPIFGDQFTCLMFAHVLDDYPKSFDPLFNVLSFRWKQAEEDDTTLVFL
ncbi:hypothetical protein DY000_02052064 [Brassica cretica]|nr:hypothetical protein DY000_02052064 [Brassica cretica]